MRRNLKKGGSTSSAAKLPRTGDGGFYSRRLAQIAGVSYYYFTRLESDAVLCLSYGAYWRRKFALPDDSPEFPVNPPFAWQDEYHGATFLRDGNAARSFVWHAAQGPAGRLRPGRPQRHGGVAEQPARRDPLELHAAIDPRPQQPHAVPGRFPEQRRLGVGGAQSSGGRRGVYAYARHRTACAALPDGKTMLFLEYAVMTKEATIDEIKGMSLKMPNDLFNGGKRVYRAPGNVELELPGNPGSTDSRHRLLRPSLDRRRAERLQPVRRRHADHPPPRVARDRDSPQKRSVDVFALRR